MVGPPRLEPDWLKLITQMVDPETNSLLLLYDDAQSIYKKKSGLGFTLSSVGIQAKGADHRTEAELPEHAGNSQIRLRLRESLP